MSAPIVSLGSNISTASTAVTDVATLHSDVTLLFDSEVLAVGSPVRVITLAELSAVVRWRVSFVAGAGSGRK